ncbi:MAG: hypothetical protein AAGU11_18615 [Syntrophobacteraceae bacterium]
MKKQGAFRNASGAPHVLRFGCLRVPVNTAADSGHDVEIVSWHRWTSPENERVLCRPIEPSWSTLPETDLIKAEVASKSFLPPAPGKRCLGDEVTGGKGLS